MKKILITGSNGLLGQKLINRLIDEKDYYIIATGKGENRHPLKGSFLYDELDVTVHEHVIKTMQRHQPDFVVHTAAMTNVDACENDKAGCIALNITATENLVQACSLLKSHFIHLSTDFIFSGTHAMYKEEEKPDPLSYYGWSKWESEKIVMQLTDKYTIVRTILVYGVVADMSRSNIVLWAKNALEKNLPISVVDDQFRTPTFAEDLSDAIFNIIEKKAMGIYHIAGPQLMSIKELVERVADFFQYPKNNINAVKSDTLNQPAKRPPVTGLDISKAKKDLGYHPHTFEEGLEIIKQQIKVKL